jgi:hypothetical protein
MKECLFICFIGVYSIGFSQVKANTTFSVDVKEFAMFFDFTYYINSDSIYIIKKTFLPKENKEGYTRKWTEQEKSEIIRLMWGIPLQSLNSSYHKADGIATDDNAQFIFHFSTDRYDKKVEIYEFKVGTIADFVAAVNKRLPEKYRIGYDEKYFGR